MKKPAWGGAGGSGDKGRIAGTARLDLHTAYGSSSTRIELTDALAEQVKLLQAFYGLVAFLTPAACASCAEALPPGPRETLAVGSMNGEPIVFFLCGSCFEASLRGSARVDERVYRRIDELAALQEQLSRTADA